MLGTKFCKYENRKREREKEIQTERERERERERKKEKLHFFFLRKKEGKITSLKASQYFDLHLCVKSEKA